MLNGDAIIEVDASAIDAAEIDLSNIELALYDLQAGPAGQATSSTPANTNAPSANQPNATRLNGDLTSEATESVALESRSDLSNDSVQSSVAFVDASLANLEQLLGQLKSSYEGSDSTLEIVLLDNSQSGIQQVSNYFADSDHDYAAVHFVTHGGSGQFQLGSDWINIYSLNEQSQQIAAWQDSLTG